MTLRPHITMVTLGVADVARSTRFYEALGWETSSASNPRISFFKLNGTKLALFHRDALAEDAGVPALAPPGGITLSHNLESEAEVDTAYWHALGAGARPVKEPVKAPWGGYSATFADPDGHLWELAFNPFAPSDETGHMVLP